MSKASNLLCECELIDKAYVDVRDQATAVRVEKSIAKTSNALQAKINELKIAITALGAEINALDSELGSLKSKALVEEESGRFVFEFNQGIAPTQGVANWVKQGNVVNMRLTQFGGGPTSGNAPISTSLTPVPPEIRPRDVPIELSIPITVDSATVTMETPVLLISTNGSLGLLRRDASSYLGEFPAGLHIYHRQASCVSYILSPLY